MLSFSHTSFFVGKGIHVLRIHLLKPPTVALTGLIQLSESLADTLGIRRTLDSTGAIAVTGLD
jgi:hypothetical protein